jgi:hypothetical protein
VERRWDTGCLCPRLVSVGLLTACRQVAGRADRGGPTTQLSIEIQQVTERFDDPALVVYNC